jgi:hypothetical protein
MDDVKLVIGKKEVLRTRVTAAMSGPTQFPAFAAAATSTARWMPSMVASSGSNLVPTASTPATAMIGCKADTPAATIRVSMPCHSVLSNKEKCQV